MTPVPIEETVPDDLDLPDDAPAGPEEVPPPRVGLTASVGVVRAELPASANFGIAIGIRPVSGLRLELYGESWSGRAYLPRTERIVPFTVPSVAVGVLFEGATKAAARPFIGASAGGALVMSRPVSVAPVLAGRIGVDVGRKTFAWTFSGTVGVLVAPGLPALAGPTYRAVAPVLALCTGPSVRL